MTTEESEAKLEECRKNLRRLQTEREEATRLMRFHSEDEYRLTEAVRAERRKIAEILAKSVARKKFIVRGTPLAAG